MKLGIFVALNQHSAPITTLAPAIEERGFDALFVPEHTHIPVGSVLRDGTAVPAGYADLPDPFIVLTAAAAVTTRLMLGTGVCLLIQRDAIITAKATATIAELSGGRLLLGVGAGWNRLELNNHGVAFDSRFKRLEEQVEAMRVIWRDSPAEYHGKQVSFGPIHSGFKPGPSRTPSVLFGGESEHTLRRIVRCGDGWLPRMFDPARTLSAIARLHELAREAGRDPATLSVNPFGVAAEPRAIEQVREAGADRAILALQAGPIEECLRRLDRLATLLPYAG